MRLKGNVADADSSGNLLANGLEFVIEGGSELQDISALVHDHAQYDSGFSVVTNQVTRGVFVATLHDRNII